MGVIRVAFLQLTAGATVEDNLRSGLAACREAREHGADIALLPEVWSHGYELADLEVSGAAERWRESALPEDSDFVGAHRALAAETGLAIALTFIYGYSTFTRAFQDLLARKISADQAVTIAALAALYVGEYLAAAEVVYIMLVGETLEAYAARRFQTDLSKLLSCLPPQAHVERDGREQEIPLEEVQAGERVVVYPGERVPVSIFQPIL